MPPVPAPVELGVSVHESLLTPDPGARRAVLDHVADAGLDHVTVGDHLSFHGGTGFDGLVSATAVLAGHDTLRVLVGVYLAGLRHPLATARQLSTLAEIAPGRLVLGIGVGGEDRSEIANAGVDPRTRGRRLDETIDVLRGLATGDAVDHDGEFFTLADARVLPAPSPRVPLVIGGAGESAVRRTAQRGDGWLGMFCSARRYRDTVEQIAAAAEPLDRLPPEWFGLSVWCGLGADEASARATLGERMQALYQLPPEKFQHVTAAGTPEQVAERLSTYVASGARNITIIPAAGDVHEGIEAVAQVRRLLRAEHAGVGA